MLVLTRVVGDYVIINDDIRIEILRVQGKKIRFGIRAPSAVRITYGPHKKPAPDDTP